MEKIMIFGIAAMISFFALSGNKPKGGPATMPPVQSQQAIDRPNVNWHDPGFVPAPPRIAKPIKPPYRPKEPCKL